MEMTERKKNEVIKRKKHVLQEMACVMIHTHDTLAYFWAEPLALLVTVPIVFHMSYGKERSLI